MTTETTGAPEGVTEDTSFAAMEAAINGDQTDATDDDGQEEAETPADDAGAPEGEQPAPKPRKSAQERIDEVTAARREAERKAEEAERRAAYWEGIAQGQQTTTPANAPAPQEDGEPNPDDYEYGETDARFIRDHATHHARKAAREEFAQQAAQSRQQAVFDTFTQRVQAQYPAGPPAGLLALQRAQSIPTAITDVILASESGPKLADHLGTNPGELARLSALPPTLQAYELAKIEARITTAPPPRKTATDAPPATPQVRGAGGQFGTAPDTQDFAAFERMAAKGG